MYKSMKHAGTKEIVPYKLYVPPLEAAYLEVILYWELDCWPIHKQIRALKMDTYKLCAQPSEGKTTVKWGFCSYLFNSYVIDYTKYSRIPQENLPLRNITYNNIQDFWR